MSSVTNSRTRNRRVVRSASVRPKTANRNFKVDDCTDDPAHARTADPRQAVRDALDEELRSRPTTMWQAFWDGFRRA